MLNIDVIAVFGPDDETRGAYSRALARTTGRTLVPAFELLYDHDPGSAALDYLRWFSGDVTAVAELPATALPAELIAACASDTNPDVTSVKLSAIVCVVSAEQLMDELTTEDFLVAAVDSCGCPSDFIARASITATQIELAQTVLVTNWQHLTTAQLSQTMALISALSPTATVRLADPHALLIPGTAENTAVQDRAGWMQILSGCAAPPFQDSSVSWLRYEQLRPFHPQRLAQLLQHDFTDRRHGTIVRSGGFCRFATRQGELLLWDQVGSTIAFHQVSSRADDDPEYFAVSQDLALIGIGLDHGAITESLDAAVLSDEEFAAGPALWRELVDPFPASETASDTAG